MRTTRQIRHYARSTHDAQELTQSELALKVGAPQSSIARLESRQSTRNLDFVRPVADALDCTLEVRFVPKKSVAKAASGPAAARQRSALKKAPGKRAGER